MQQTAHTKLIGEKNRMVAASDQEQRWQWVGQRGRLLEGLGSMCSELVENYSVSRSIAWLLTLTLVIKELRGRLGTGVGGVGILHWLVALYSFFLFTIDN